jgi:hypothetical protein
VADFDFPFSILTIVTMTIVTNGELAQKLSFFLRSDS